MFYKTINYVIIFLLIVCLAGCSNDSRSKHSDDLKLFNKIYSETIVDLETTDAIKTMEQLQTEKSKKNIDELKKILDEIKENIPTDKEMLYDNIKRQYEDLLFLKDSYNSYEDMGLHEKRRMGIILVNIAMNKDH